MHDKDRMVYLRVRSDGEADTISAVPISPSFSIYSGSVEISNRHRVEEAVPAFH